MISKRFFPFIIVAVMLLAAAGCGTWERLKSWAGYGKAEDVEEETVPPEAQEETVMVDGKPYVRSKNPYWLTYPDQPEYIYVEKGREFKGMQSYIMDALAKRVAAQQQKAAGRTIPPDKLQEMVRAEVDRILREQGLGGYVSRTRDKAPYSGRAVAVLANPDAPASYQGLSLTLATTLADALGRQKDIKVVPADKVREALAKAGVHGKLSLRRNIQALGDALGVQAVVLAGVVPPEKGTTGFYAVEIYDAFLGNKVDSVVGPAGSEGLRPEGAARFVREHTLRTSAALLEVDWFGRVEFIREGKVYLNLGQNAGLKVGDRLRVVTPGKEVVNPQTGAVLGYTADETQGELKVTELLGTTGAVATALKGGPFKPNDKVKAVQ
ncbi:MAG: hypothetical protein K6T55_09930 [Syntrophobacterales bacterium]|nr:hypothetical protein [Syntrophobacterales bacterium]